MPKRNAKEFIDRTESKIDSGWRELQIFQTDRPTGLLGVITATDDSARFGLFVTQSYEDWFWSGVRSGQDALLYAIPWIFELSKCSDAPVPSKVGECQYKQGLELFTYADAYQLAVNGFTHYHRGRFAAFVAQREPRITFAYASNAEAAGETEERAYEIYEQQQALKRLPIEELRREYSNLRELILDKSAKDGTDRVRLVFDNQLVSALRRARDASLLIHERQVEESQTFHGIPYRNYARYFAALHVLSDSHFSLHSSPLVKDIERGAISSLALRMRFSELVQLISEIGEMELETVARMSALFAYDGSVPNLDPICQPLIRANEGEVIIPHVFVGCSGSERNIFKLLAKHPQTTNEYQRFSSSKEDLALSELLDLLSHMGIAARKNVRVLKDSELLTDIDLLAFDPRDECLLVVQHKWLIQPDTINETRESDRQLADGMKQVQDVKSNLIDQSYARRLMNEIPARGYAHLEGLVISRGTEPTGFVAETDVPVVTEEWFRRNIQTSPGLKALHQLATVRPDRKELAREWEMSQRSVDLAGYELRIPVLTKTTTRG